MEKVKLRESGTGFLTIKMKNLTLGLRKWLKKLEFRVSV